MKIKTHSKPLTSLALLLLTDRYDLAAWIEEFILEMREIDKPDFHTLGEELSREELSTLSKELIGHYYMENVVFESNIRNLLPNLQIF